MIPFNKASVSDLEIEYVVDAMKNSKLSGDGKYTAKVQAFMKDRFGIENLLLTTSGTTALELASLLETAYASLDTDESRQSVSDIKCYLHKRGIEVVDYSDETNMYFNRMPASRTCTLKPAIVKNKVALIRGMAAVKSR